MNGWQKVAGFVAMAVAALPAMAQAWKPTRNIEIIVGSAPGGGADITGRVMQKIFQEKLLTDVPSAVANRTGGGSAISYVALNQHPGDGHYVALSLQPMVTGAITGASQIKHTDVTPLAHLFNEYVGFAVRPDSPLRSARDVVERLKKDPTSVSFAVSTALAGSNHLAAVVALKAAGVDIRRLRVVVMKGAGDSIAAVLGGHVDVAATSGAALIPHLGAAGKLRGIAISSPKRISGVYADVPTWTEVVGADAAYSNWRGVVGPRGLSAAQIAFWDDLLGRLSASDEWKADLEKRFQEPAYRNSAETRRFLDREHEQFRSILGELGLAK
jgi:putative tricarboxylic transport membrane protein